MFQYQLIEASGEPLVFDTIGGGGVGGSSSSRKVGVTGGAGVAVAAQPEWDFVSAVTHFHMTGAVWVRQAWEDIIIQVGVQQSCDKLCVCVCVAV